MTKPDVNLVAAEVARALVRAGVEFAVGGSVASSVWGDPRFTRDLDFAVRMTEADVPGLVAAFGADFAVDPEMLREAARTGRSANIFFLPVFMKIDLFVRGREAYDDAEFERRRSIEVLPGERIPASSPEDNLLWKLRWFRMGGEVSDQQWRDVLGLLRVSGASMDLLYVRRWARHFSVDDLLERALAQQSV